jgi:[acyl-carrier-protein] S-malonyltransferase
VNAEPVLTTARATALLRDQLSSPVRWSDLVLALAKRYPTALYVEMGPGSVLSGLAKKIAPSLLTATCGTAAEAQQLRELAIA